MKKELREELVKFFKEEFSVTLQNRLKIGYSLKKFKINPFVLISTASGVFGEPTSKNMAKALLYPRVLGTSISTSFGDKMQALCTHYLGATGSAVEGMDIEFTDKTTNQRMVVQLKSGPNTINSGDVKPIIDHMNKAYRLYQQNREKVIPNFAIGIVYGALEDVSQHYKNIMKAGVGSQPEIPLLIGKDFWHRVTGDESFYAEMIMIFFKLFENENYSKDLDLDIKLLSKEIEARYFTNGKLDASRF